MELTSVLTKAQYASKSPRHRYHQNQECGQELTVALRRWDGEQLHAGLKKFLIASCGQPLTRLHPQFD